MCGPLAGPGRHIYKPAMPADPRRHAPATLRNREPILDALRPILPSRGLVLEIASGTGEHAAYFAGRLPHLQWQPSDLDLAARISVDAYREAAGVANLAPAMALDVAREWPIAVADVVLCINMIHIAPWDCCAGLLRGAGQILPTGGPLILYGPFTRGGRHIAPSNAAFDRSLRAQNPDWGVRDLEAVAAAAEPHGLRLDTAVAMPANNLTVVLRKE